MNSYKDIDSNMLLILDEGSRTRGRNAALDKEQHRLDIKKVQMFIEGDK